MIGLLKMPFWIFPSGNLSSLLWAQNKDLSATSQTLLTGFRLHLHLHLVSHIMQLQHALHSDHIMLSINFRTFSSLAEMVNFISANSIWRQILSWTAVILLLLNQLSLAVLQHLKQPKCKANITLGDITFSLACWFVTVNFSPSTAHGITQEIKF